jgi:hypothetical protein
VQGFLDGSLDIGHVTDHTPSLNWTFYDPDPGDNQVAYNATVWDGAMSALLWFNNVTSPSDNDVYNSTGTATADLVDGTDYWFNVSVFDGSAWSGWTDVMFHMNVPPPTAVPPLSPADDAVISSSPGQVLSWSSGGLDADSDEITYYWYVDIDNPPVPPYNASGFTTGTSSTPFATAMSTDYYWYVNATDGWEWNTTIVWNFTTTGLVNNPPEARNPSVQGYLQGSQQIMNLTNHTPDLGWTFYDPDVVDSQQQYEVEVWTGPSGTGANMWDPPAGSGGTNMIPYTSSTPLSDGVTYFFRIRVNDGSTWSTWNETMFHMNAPPPAPALANPLSGTVGIPPVSQTITWNAAVDPEGSPVEYHWYVSTDASFAAISSNGTTTSTTSAPFNTVQATTYYWRVQANDGYEFGSNSTTWNFTTNRPPTLDWTGESGYSNDGVDPDQGNSSTSFEFRISYSDEDNQSGTVRLVILQDSTEILNSTMSETDSGDVTYSDGKLYALSELLEAGTYSYYFFAADSVGASIKTSEKQLVVSEVRGKIKGIVTDESDVPLENAKVQLLKDGQAINSTFTNNLGEFEFPDLEFGTYAIEISKDGYYGKTTSANLNQPLVETEPIKLNKIEEFPWWIILVLVIIMVLVLLILLLLLKRKKKEDEIDESQDTTKSSNEDLEQE